MSDLPLDDGFYATPHRFLWHPESATAILSDLHLGIEATLNAHGMDLPATNVRSLQDDWIALAARLAAARTSRISPRLIIAGDFFDARQPNVQTLNAANELLATIAHIADILFIPGNHDPAAEKLAKTLFQPRLLFSDHAVVGGYTVIHGDQSHVANGKGRGRWVGEGERRMWIPRGLIVGHQHPCVVLYDRVQSAKMICFAEACLPIAGATVHLLLLPAFSRISLGSNLRIDRYWILDLPRPADSDIRIAGIVRNQVLDFGPLDQL